ncbi:hypothetical protein CWI75_15300 [Kineobactrum sediminis]|uniref:Tryptophan synthase subunit beta like protein n=1 Tax=Kineobactrum sediminis TaxID=1905677 RepID=A0A2N5XZL9_9GAMM|nr:hypothetical protein [Kineobactrum sediminis]PLW81592.1 hypothetical protein CWI75_15300 [Kineobactrum sediminis]
MPYIKRDNTGNIIAASQVADAGLEQISADDSELQGFLGSLAEDVGQLSATDQDFVRVLEDLVELLVSRGVILFTELPQSAQQKILFRQRLRNKLPGSLDLLGDD